MLEHHGPLAVGAWLICANYPVNYVFHRHPSIREKPLPERILREAMVARLKAGLGGWGWEKTRMLRRISRSEAEGVPRSHQLPRRLISEVDCPAVKSKAVTCLTRYSQAHRNVTLGLQSPTYT